MTMREKVVLDRGDAVEALVATTAIPVGWPLGPAPEKGAIARAMDALDWLFWRIAASELARWAPECDLYLLPSPPIAGLHPLSPTRARQLIDDAERMTREWLPHATTWQQPRADG